MRMKDFDILQLNGQVIQTFLVILEESSVSRAAERLDLTQSAVSHTLARLRQALGDPLFVRSGQGLTPTETALRLKGPAQDVLDRMKGLTDQRPFDPKSEVMRFSVAANDMQRDLIFPELMRTTMADGIDLRLEIKPSGVPSVTLLRDARCDLMLTPLPPDAPDLIQKKLFSGEMCCFYDASQIDPPRTMEEFLAAEHIAVQFVLGGSSYEALKSRDLPYIPKPRLTVSNFAGITPFVLGSRMVTTQAGFMRHTSLRGLDREPVPFEAEPVVVFMVWHQRSTNDPAHKWLRNRIVEIASRWD